MISGELRGYPTHCPWIFGQLSPDNSSQQIIGPGHQPHICWLTMARFCRLALSKTCFLTPYPLRDLWKRPQWSWAKLDWMTKGLSWEAWNVKWIDGEEQRIRGHMTCMPGRVLVKMSSNGCGHKCRTEEVQRAKRFPCLGGKYHPPLPESSSMLGLNFDPCLTIIRGSGS